MNSPFLSIIVVNYNGAKWLPKFLNSIYHQTYQNLELLFVDNNSIDGSKEYLRDIADKNRNIRLIENPHNKGFASGNKIGIENAHNSLILLINSDTWFDPNFIQELINYKIKSGQDIVAPIEVDYTSDFNTSLGNSYTSTIDLWGHGVFIPQRNKEITNSFFLSGVCLLFDKKIYLDSGGFDTDFFMYFEDVDWFWRLNLLGNIRFGYASQVRVHHYFSGNASVTDSLKYNTFLWRNQNTLQMLLKNYSLINLMWVIPSYMIISIFEATTFLLLGKFKIAYTYLEGFIYNIKYINRTLKKRREIQKLRKVSDSLLLKKMYFGYGKLRHVIQKYKNNEK